VLSFGTPVATSVASSARTGTSSKARIDEHRSEEGSPEAVVELALRSGCAGIAYTYNDPVIWAEYAIDIARLAREAGLKNIFVTAGYVTPEASPRSSATWTPPTSTSKRQRRLLSPRNALAPRAVKETLVWLKHETDVWFEITTLLIPGRNDSDRELTRNATGSSPLSAGVPVPLHGIPSDFKMTISEHAGGDAAPRARHRAPRVATGFVVRRLTKRQ